MQEPIPFRAVSFHHSHVDPDYLDRAAVLGFNAIELQVEGDTLEGLRGARQRLDERDVIAHAHRLGMKVALWTHELSSYDPDEFGPPSVDNQRMWSLLEERYRHVLTEQYADIDYLTLTVVETQHNLTKSGCLQKLTELLARLCDDAGKTLIFRSFVWHPDEQAEVVKTIAALPQDVIIQTKYVPQDWHLRSINHPLLGRFPEHVQFVEMDAAGEYWRKSYVANCMADDLAARCACWVEKGVRGLVVRVDRRWREDQHSVFGQVQEANLWLLGAWARGLDVSIEARLQEYAAATFGEKVAAPVAEAIRTTGLVTAEAQCVLTETLDDTRNEVPCCRTMEQSAAARRYDDADDTLHHNPFHKNWSTWRWDASKVATYQKLRRGDPEVIAQKLHGYEEARGLATRSIALVRENEAGFADPAGYRFLLWKLEENLWHLDVMCQVALAWLKATRRLYSDDPAQRQRLTEELLTHLDALEKLRDRADRERIDVTWQGRRHELHRGEYMDVGGFLARFREFWAEAAAAAGK